MSLDAIRDGLLRTKKNELTACENSRKRKLRELYAVTTDLRPEQLIPLQLDTPFSDAELRFLHDNDITKGRYFQESTLPVPPRWTQPPAHRSLGASFEISNSATSGSPHSYPAADEDSVSAPASLPKGVPVEQAAARQAETDELGDGQTVDQKSLPSSPGLPSTAVPKLNEVPVVPQSIESSVVDPQNAIPPSLEDVAALPDTVNVQGPSNKTPKAPKTIHLPPKAEQEQHLREIEHAQENARRREKKEDGKLLATINGTTMDDMPSSPSSTAGPFSVNTPMPTQHSPDTSPEEDNPTDAISLHTPISMGPTKQEQNEKEEHDRIMKMQQEIARQEARGNVATTADAQLRLEEQQAVQQARDHGEHAISGARPGQSDAALTDNAVSLVDDVVAARQEDKDIIGDDDVTETRPLQEEHEDNSPVVTPQDDFSTRDDMARQVIPAPSTKLQDSVQKTPSTSRPSALETTLTDTRMPDVSSPPVGSLEEAPSQKKPPPTPSQAAPERSTTRLSSGAIRHKSVSEILGETPKPASPSVDKTPIAPNFTDQPLASSPGTATPLTSSVLATLSNNQVRISDRKDKERSKLSAVVFAKPDNAASVSVRGEYSQLAGVSKDARKDYYQTMFVSQAYSPPRAQHLSELLGAANKVLTTSNRYAEVREHLDNRVLKRVYQLQNANKWSLRQLERATEPPHSMTHLDYLLQEMKWMRTDFKEERKWKTTTARNLAYWCAKWVAADKEQRVDLQVKVKAPPPDTEPLTHTPSLVPGAESKLTETHNASINGISAIESIGDIENVQQETSLQLGVTPDTVFSLGLEDSLFTLPKGESSSKLISELPSFQVMLDAPLQKVTADDSLPAILPVSKYVHGRVLAMSTASPKKRSRYEYQLEDEPILENSKHQKPEDDSSASIATQDLPPEQKDVALFFPENKGLRDRLHAGHAFRPPSEFQMPPTSFYENRASSQWLWDEDQKLRALVKDYTYNWSLISDSLSISTSYPASPERRTPWECFERWVQLEGLPAEMSKMQYFRTYQARLDAAQRTVTAHQQAQQQLMAQQGNAAGIQTPLRRRTTVPVRVERRRSGKYLSIIEAMRKLARKREALAHKQQEAAKAAALRKHHEAPPPKAGVHTPQEFSNLKHEQEVKLHQKRQELYRQQIMATQRQAALQQQQRATQQGNAQQGMPNGAGSQQRPGSNPTGSGANLAPPPNPHAQQAMNMQRQQMIQQGMQNNVSNGSLGVPNMGMQGMPQAPMQMHMQGHQRMSSHQSPENVRAMLARQARPNTYQNPNSSQYQIQQNNPTQLAAAHMMPANSGIQNQQMLAAAMQNANQNLHVNGSSANGIVSSTDNSNSPQRNRAINPSPQQPQTLSSGHVPAINELIQRLKVQNPTMPDQEAQRLAMEQLKERMASQKYHQQRQNAINAAVGASGATFAHQQQAQQALQSSQNQAAAQQQHQAQQGQATPQIQNTHSQTQNITTAMNWNSPVQSHPQPHGHGHHPSHNHSNSQGHIQSPQMTHLSPHLQSSSLNSYQQQLSQQLTNQQRSMIMQQQQHGLHSASPANVGAGPMSGIPNMGAGMGGGGGLGSPAQIHAGAGSPSPMTAAMLRPPSAGADMGIGSRSATPMQRPGTAGAE